MADAPSHQSPPFPPTPPSPATPPTAQSAVAFPTQVPTRRPRVFLPAILSGLLSYTAFFPANLGVMAWFALVPMLWVIRVPSVGRRQRYAAVFLGGICCYLPAIQWIRVAHPAQYATWVGLSLYCSIGLMFIAAITRRLDRRGVPLIVSFPVAVTAIEYVRSHFPTGFSWLDWFGVRHSVGFGWYQLGHTQHEFSLLLQTADLAGVYGISFLIAMVNAAVFERLAGSATDRRVVPIHSVITAGLLFAAIIYGAVRLRHDPYPDGPWVGLIQGNLPQSIKMEHGPRMAKHFMDLCDEASRTTPPLDLIVWPETSWIDPWVMAGPGVPVELLDARWRREIDETQRFAEAAGRRWKTNLLLGLNGIEIDSAGKSRQFNSAVLFDRQGRLTSMYHKVHLVPFGEYVPMLDTFPFMQRLTPYEGAYGCVPGHRNQLLRFAAAEREYRMGCLICYEDTDPAMAREFISANREPVDCFVNISNDGWFDGTEEHEQHLAIARFRAVETRRSLIRSVNMGISGVIDPDGAVIALPGDTWSTSKKVEAVVRSRVPLGQGTTLYVLIGDWVPIGGVLFFLAVWFGRSRNRSDVR